MKDKIFIDSNIFLYAFNDDDIEKQKVATKIIMNENGTVLYYIGLNTSDDTPVRLSDKVIK
ncbi:MAG: hypothetical protein U9N59_10050 [Campylobacterota bacterium]|nr:hypothetical protein [Campylobacterota bacterium]